MCDAGPLGRFAQERFPRLRESAGEDHLRAEKMFVSVYVQGDVLGSVAVRPDIAQLGARQRYWMATIAHFLDL